MYIWLSMLLKTALLLSFCVNNNNVTDQAKQETAAITASLRLQIGFNCQN